MKMPGGISSNMENYLVKRTLGLEKLEYINNPVERKILFCRRVHNTRRKVLQKAKDNHRLRKYISPVPCENYLKMISKQ